MEPRSPTDEMYGQPRKYLRFWADFEIEVVDPMAAASFTMDWTNEGGTPAMAPYRNQNQQMEAAVSQAVCVALKEIGLRAGFRWIGGGPQIRPVDENGDYPEFIMLAMPGREDDGTPRPIA